MKRILISTLMAISVSLAACGGGNTAADAPAAFGEPQLVAAWTKIQWYFRSNAEAAQYEADKTYEAAALAGVHLDRKGNMYVTTPRWMSAKLPSTLSQVVTVNGSPLLLPFPNWDAHDLTKANSLRNVLGFNIDSKNRMWLVDMGWVAGESSVPDGAQKIVVIDLNTGVELKRYPIPDSVANRNTSFLNDLVIDEKREVAYITDSGNRSVVASADPAVNTSGKVHTAAGIVIYDYKTNSARRVLDMDKSVVDDFGSWLTVSGDKVFSDASRLAVGINGIALSNDGQTLYWNVTVGDGVYNAPTSVLLDPAMTAAQVSAAVKGPLKIGGGSDGMTSDSKGRIYSTNLTDAKVQYFTATDPTWKTVATSPGKGKGFDWPDTLAWDDTGGLYVTTNWLNKAFTGQLKFDGAPNYRIYRIQTDAQFGYVK